MENNNAVPEGHDPAAGAAEPPVTPTPDSEVPEFLKGPDPDGSEHDGPEHFGAVPEREEPATAGAGPDTERDAWDAEFSSVDGADPAAETTTLPADDTTAHARGTTSGEEPADAERDAAPGPAGRQEETADPGHAPATATESTDTMATEYGPAATQALPAWQQEPAAEPETAVQKAGQDGEAPEAGQPAQDQPAAAEAAAVPAAAGAVQAAKRRGGTPRQPGEPSDPEAQRRQNARDAALTAKPRFARVVQTVLAIFFPFLLVIGAIRTVASSWFLWLEYHRPGFPADGYGFSPAERLTYGNYGVDYINNSAPSAYLGNLVDGKGDPLFLGTEVSHMADVKSVIGITYAAGIIMAVLAVIICLYLGRRYAGGIRRAFFAGSVITLVAMIALTVLAVLNFETFFTDFHELFFAQGNWTFHVNDTLIRLYPTQFWMDAGVAIAGLVLLISLVFLITNWPTRKRRERARLRQGNRDLGLD